MLDLDLFEAAGRRGDRLCLKKGLNLKENQFTVKVKHMMLHSNQQLPLIPSTLWKRQESFGKTY